MKNIYIKNYYHYSYHLLRMILEVRIGKNRILMTIYRFIFKIINSEKKVECEF